MSSLQSPSDASACNDLVYGLNDRPSALITLLVALQYLLAIIVPIATLGLLICQALGVSPCDTNPIVSMSLVIFDIAIFVQCKHFGPSDAGLLIVQGTSSNFVGPLIAGGALMVKQDTPVEGTVAAIFDVVITGFFVKVGISRILPSVKRLITPLVTNIAVLMIGLTPIKVGLIGMGGGSSAISNGTFANGENLLLSGVVLGVIVALNRIPAVWIRSCAIVITLAIGYTLAGYLSYLDFIGIYQAELSQVPTPLHSGLNLSWPLFIPTLIIYLVAFLEAIGDVTATNKVSRQPVGGPPWMQRIKGGVLVNGASLSLVSTFSTLPSSVFAQNNGMIQPTGMASYHVGLWIATISALLDLFLSATRVIQAVPEPILGGAVIVTFDAVVVSGISVLAGIQLDRHTLLIIAVSLTLSLGVSQVLESLTHISMAPHNVLESGVATGGICALLLNWFLPKSPVQKATY